ncbi:tetratricopeptide repeat protein [Salinibacter grassmerensis]|uniref:tetratricopeptide repeat protein n=1 Tax=Salinibacter grassmerensis TaxID=3040353 RepID=UPI0021E85FB1|nr:tetratricopeptide repeat protein [Salinibacter grassmerensis]
MSVPDLQEPLALLEQKDYDAAIAMLSDKVAALPAHPGAHVLLAHAYETQKRWEEALQAWAEARFLMPNSPIAEAGAQRVLRRLEDHNETSFTFAFPPSLRSPSNADADTDAGDVTSPTDEPEDTPDDEDAGLAQLRRQAEREARQGGARPGLSDAPPSSDLPSSPDEDPPTPEEQVEELEDEGDAGDLDHLINELQSARIEPEAEPEAEAPPPEADDEAEMAAEDDDTEDIVSETLARIHEGQDDYREAARIYATLAEQEPDRADEFQEKADEMRLKADESDEEA